MIFTIIFALTTGSSMIPPTTPNPATTTSLEDAYEYIFIFMTTLTCIMGCALFIIFYYVCYRRSLDQSRTNSANADTTNTYVNMGHTDDCFTTKGTQTVCTYLNPFFKPSIFIEEDESKIASANHPAILEMQDEKIEVVNGKEFFDDVMGELNKPLEEQGKVDKQSDEASAAETTLVTMEVGGSRDEKYDETAKAVKELQGYQAEVTDETASTVGEADMEMVIRKQEANEASLASTVF